MVSLRNLSPEESRQYLHACGVDPARHDQLVELAHSHPLGHVRPIELLLLDSL